MSLLHFPSAFSLRGPLLLHCLNWTLCLGCLQDGFALAAPLRPRDLIGAEAAFVSELMEPKAAWQEFQNGELFRRLQSTELFQTLIQSSDFRKFESLERGVTEVTGRSLSSLVLDLAAKELAVAVYFSDSNQPQGVLVTRALDAASVQRVLQAWQKLEPQSQSQSLKHQGQTYFRRAAAGSRKAALFYVTFGEVFAISDHEARIQQVIDFQKANGDTLADAVSRFPRLPATSADRPANVESKLPPVTARVWLQFHAWDSVLQEASPDDEGAKLLRRFWPALHMMTMELRQDSGLHLETRLQLHADQTDDIWKSWSAPTPAPDKFLETVPAQALLVASGGIHFQALWKFLQAVVPSQDQKEWTMPRRVFQGLLGGLDVVDDLLPALTHQMGLFLLSAPDAPGLPFDGVIALRFSHDHHPQDLSAALDQVFTAGLTLLAIHLHEKHPDTQPATVHAEVAEARFTRWMETSLPPQVAYQVTPAGLTVSRSIQTLRQYLAGESTDTSESSFAALRKRWFPVAGQFVCVDLRRLREQGQNTPSAENRHVAENFGSVTQKVSVPRQLARVVDAAYLATQFDSDHVALRLGVIVDPSP